MARHYYLTRAGRLRRKDNTLCFEPAAQGEQADAGEEGVAMSAGAAEGLLAAQIGAMQDELGDLALEPEALATGAEIVREEEGAAAEEAAAPVKVSDRRVIPVEDVDAIWVFSELELNARALIFLAQHKVPVHFFNYYVFTQAHSTRASTCTRATLWSGRCAIMPTGACV